MVLILPLIIYLSEHLAFSVVLLSSVAAPSQFATGTLWNCMSQQLHWWPDLHEFALWNNILPLNVWLCVSASTIWLPLVFETWTIRCKSSDVRCNVYYTEYLWILFMINIYFLLNLISILLFVECVCSSCCSYRQNTVAARAAVVNASNVHFDHVFENGRLPSGRIIRCGTCGWILKQFQFMPSVFIIIIFKDACLVHFAADPG